ncbi:MAG: 3-hydroxyacyl-[acyl-carrier-protein] dehydratase FabZ, partial [Alphaproteobacteria bacterium HGW-Alphaproteobacteria-1]
MTDPLKSADIHLIQRIIPHRYPFLLVDRVVDIDGYQSARGIKCVTMN